MKKKEKTFGELGTLRLCVVNSSSGLGGAERVLLNVLHPWFGLSKRKISSIFIPGSGPLNNEFKAAGWNVQQFDLGSTFSQVGDSPVRREGALSVLLNLICAIPDLVRCICSLRKMIKTNGADVYLANGFKAQILVTLAIPKTKLLIWFMQDFISSRKMVSRIIPWIWRKGIHVIADSRAVAADVGNLLPICPITVWHNTVDVTKYLPGDGDPSWLDFEAGFSSDFDGLRIGLVATFARWKGHKVFMEAARDVLNKIPRDVRFYIIGGPIYGSKESQWKVEELGNFAQELGISKKLGFVNFQKDTVRVYRSLDIVVHASTNPEPFGQVIIEAMACGKPVIVAASGGAAEIGVHEKTCLHHQPGNVKSLSDSILQLVQGDTVRGKLGKAAREEVEEKFGTNRVEKRWVDFLKETESPC